MAMKNNKSTFEQQVEDLHLFLSQLGSSNRLLVPKKRLFSVTEAAEFLGRPVYSVRLLIYSKTLPVVKDTPDSRKYYIDINDLERFIAERKTYEI